MAAFDFPASPTNGQQYTANGVTYVWSTADGAWIGGPITDTGAFQPRDTNVTAIANLADGAIGYPWFDGGGNAVTKDAATIGEYIGGTADRVLENDNVWAAAAEVSFGFVTPFAPAMNTFINAVMPLITGNMTFNAPTNYVPGRSGVIRLTVTAGSPVTATWGADWLFVAGSKPPTLRVGDNLLFYYAVNSKLYCSMGYSYA